MKVFLCTGLVLLVSISAAEAYCPSAGRAPQAPQSYERPRPPSCLADARFGEENDCDARVLTRYRSDVAAYIRKLEDFAAAAERYADAAARYARCEADEARESLDT
ncbi:MAG: hypothetical protein GXP06_08240 [Alphaproteobacteria bacterium]|nr:hypothetical protein [Alphaproteobacteria bacterium]